LAFFVFDWVTGREFVCQGFGVTDFYVCGASKRGWTTWTVAAVDTRVKAQAPIVMDELNFIKNIHHHYRAYGGWSFVLEDYYVMNFTMYLDDPRTQMIMDIVDPFIYRDRYAGMPKFIADAGGDEFFLPDDWRFWWDQMPAPKEGIMVPNAEHSMATGILEVLPAVVTWFSAVMTGDKIPTTSWVIDVDTGMITIQVSEPPTAVHVWYSNTCPKEANNPLPQRRDFRLANLDNPCPCGPYVEGTCANLGVLWYKISNISSTPLDPLTYTYNMVAPTNGQYVAFFIDVEFDRFLTQGTGMRYGPINSRPVKNSIEVDGGYSWPITPPGVFEFTSGVSILPASFPWPQCTGVGPTSTCYSYLL
jgi:hypothetical protein